MQMYPVVDCIGRPIEKNSVIYYRAGGGREVRIGIVMDITGKEYRDYHGKGEDATGES